MAYLITTAILIACCMVFFIPSMRQFTKENELVSNFALTMVATLIGVLLAIAISNYDEDEKERRDLIKLLHAAKAVATESLEYSQAVMAFYQSNEAGSETKYSKQQFFKDNPLPYPEYLDALMSQQLFIKNLSQESLTELSESLILMKRANTHRPHLFLSSLSFVLYVLEQEQRYQKGEISLHELEKALREREAQLEEEGN
ncbi:hypothetical protein [Pseudoalteromonas luteoviolacea]|uniref:Uncharacterized protein n=1 Tax=Pseudoalteromonas luteoviolacea S4054 TaxID=1129367 RepID=A0A0F6ABR5_9GAMM|nr:hypothetical protein [Pseudoalteromonas luteoviolacea]AOT10781.1 hypothetical protein S4054249_23290 [Pseudoalteromonas luteoviolacea]AOT16056.1 hypothetical protein S40542_25215 [Pseudoalteromonas luteoviolacea]AOT20602.1 hypothetical protein S4054_23210 [Pseudoalteromonas luteoviolacea]KKE82819.1 hypothetical protein N479_16225 [Pseudoalteromonas luteoviolacea S4054]KZN75299.1 hypothetical protein N481_08255 [Pseudoalteromonas luteoviolacea S4047-1]